jgi:hypothetical protein
MLTVTIVNMIIASRAHASRFLDKNWHFQLKNFLALGKPIADLLGRPAKTQRNCLLPDNSADAT